MPLAALTVLLALQGAGTKPANSPAKPATVAATAGPKVKITDLVVGKGAQAVRPGDFLELKYVGKLASGKQFDATGDGSFRIQIGIGKVIVGWDQGLLGMRPGGKRRLEIPSALGYGVGGYPPAIPGNADLDFEVELLAIHRAKVETTKPGAGLPLAAEDVPTYHYTLTLEDGKKLASSRDNNVPDTARLQQISIPGFVQGLLGMKPGEIRRVTVTPDLAYGESGFPPVDQTDEEGRVVRAKGSMIPAKATLIFEIELVSSVRGEPKS